MSSRPTIDAFIATLNYLNITSRKAKDDWKKSIDKLHKKWKMRDVTRVKECASKLLKHTAGESKLDRTTKQHLLDICNGKWRPEPNRRPQSGKSSGINFTQEESESPRSETSGYLRINITQEERKSRRKKMTTEESEQDIHEVNRAMTQVLSTVQGEKPATRPKDQKTPVNDGVHSLVQNINQNTQGLLQVCIDMKNRLASVEDRLRTMFQTLTSIDYKEVSQKKQGKKGVSVKKPTDMFELIDEMEKKISSYMKTQADDLEKSRQKAKEEKQKDIGDVEISDMVKKDAMVKELKVMYKESTGEHYPEDKKNKVQADTLCETLGTMVTLLKHKCDRLQIYKDSVTDLERTNEDLLSRLPQVVSAEFLNNNSDIDDLSDSDRPTKIAEQYLELYDNEWTDAFDILTTKKKNDDKKAIDILLGYLTSSYTHCLRYSEMQELLMEGLIVLPATVTAEIGKSVHSPDAVQRAFRKKSDKLKGEIGDVNLKILIDLRKQTRLLSVKDVIEAGVPCVLKDRKDDAVKKYVTQCLRLCWLMCQQQPRMYIDVEVTKYQGPFDKSLYREFMKKGKKVEYVVWPPLYLQEGGHLLFKGVANGK